MAMIGGNPVMQAAALQAAQQLAGPGPAVQQADELAVARRVARAQRQSQYMRAAHALAKAQLGQGPQFFPRGYSSPAQRELFRGGQGRLQPGGLPHLGGRFSGGAGL